MNINDQGISREAFQTIIKYVDEVKDLLSSHIWENR